MSTRNDEPQYESFEGPMTLMADIAGNLPALDAVLEAAQAARSTVLLVAGGLCHRGNDPLGVWQRLQERGARCARGTADLALTTIDPDNLRPIDASQRAAADRLRWTRAQLGELILARIRRLPDTLRVTLRGGVEIAVMHGSPVDPMEAMTHDLDDDTMQVLLQEESAQVIVSGGAGVPFVRELEDVRIVGLGSVGEAPEGRVAHYALIMPTDDGLRVESRWVEY